MERSARSGRKLAAVGLLPAIASALAVGMGTQPAGAAVTETRTHTFFDGNGDPHDCTIEVVRQTSVGGDSQIGRGATTALATGDPLCDNAVASIGARFRDPDGDLVTIGQNSDGFSTSRRYAPVGTEFRTIHEVVYDGCSSACVAHFERTK